MTPASTEPIYKPCLNRSSTDFNAFKITLTISTSLTLLTSVDITVNSLQTTELLLHHSMAEHNHVINSSLTNTELITMKLQQYVFSSHYCVSLYCQ